ncbi:MAG: 2-succinyl-5-enolpyruvyl-6-hydroxy-3-cyclohexene-1-carboxylic-acid synthase [Marinilabiliaceae bacterium]
MSQPVSDKPVVRHIVELCHYHGVRYVVISPGSRNAPFILSFPANRKFNCLSIVDERSAAFFALGLARSENAPVAIVCTSGTAALNYAPALAEAYYQQIPLIAITADRPPEYIDQADGQTIRQNEIFRNYTRYSCQMPVDVSGNGDLQWVDRTINEAFRHALGIVPGPVHINVPLQEPLYGRCEKETSDEVKGIPVTHSEHVDEKLVRDLTNEINDYRKILFVIGARHPGEDLDQLVSEMAGKRMVVLSENLSNLEPSAAIGHTDRILEGFPEDDSFRPDLLITLEVPVLSKRLKQRLRKLKPRAHWHFSNQNILVDTYGSLTRQIPGNEVGILTRMMQNVSFFPPDYAQLWQKIRHQTSVLHCDFLKEQGWSDLKVFRHLSVHVPSGHEVHLANSTPVRYAQLFDWSHGLRFYANRGTSGIDGCVSTAAGAAFSGKRPVTLITGDLAFFYDANGLWHQYLPSSFRVIVINNGGGGIFRFIPGPSDTEELEPFFEARGGQRSSGIAETFGLQYFAAGNEDELDQILRHFWDEKGTPALLEIFTPTEDNGEILKAYFRFLGQD